MDDGANFMDLLITLTICLTCLAAVATIAIQIGRTSRANDRQRWEHEWKEMTHKETMAQIEAMKPLPPAPAPEPRGFLHLLDNPRFGLPTKRSS